jgi:cell division protein FtsI/penicillin-binding protein 2
VKAIGNTDTPAISKGRVMTTDLAATLTELMRHVITTVPLYKAGTLIPGFEVGGKTGTAQIWDPTTGHWKVNLFNYSFVGYIARQPGHPDLVIAIRIEEGQPTRIKQGQLELPVMSFELFRRIAHDAITTPYLIPDVQAVPTSSPAAP